MKYLNPILSGFHPDPSICRVGKDYYIVNSTFELFPGIPIYHSRNLINWRLAGYCLTDESQLCLDNCRPSGGIYAPTIRHHGDTFFVTATNVTHGGNFIVHSQNLEGGWSNPVWVNQGGIDPSLFFDDDGKVYFTSTGRDQNGKPGIFLCQVNPFTGEKQSDSVLISYGCGGRYPEGPHLYKRGGKYYLLLAEGGTEYGHMETAQRADSPYGPYEPCPHNPILSNRDDMSDEICCTGHADLVEDGDGNWWMVCLGIRTCGNAENPVMLHNLGRETFLSPVRWDEDRWPVAGVGGILSKEMDGPLPGGKLQPVNRSFRDDFSGNGLDLNYNFLRNPVKENYQLLKEKRQLVLNGTDITLNDVGSPTWLGIRQKGFETVTEVEVSLAEEKREARVGITAYYNNTYHYEIYLTRVENSYWICLAKHVHDIFVITDVAEISVKEKIRLRITSDKEYYRFSYSLPGREFRELGSGITAGLCTETTRTVTFTGTYLAMFAEHAVGIFRDFEVSVLEV